MIATTELCTNQTSASLQPLTTAFPSTSQNVAHFLTLLSTLGSDQIQEK
jgi:hypothetical protein